MSQKTVKHARKGKSITLAGQSASGKTNMLASLLFNNNAREELCSGQDAISDPAFSLRDFEDPSDTNHLGRHYWRMKSGMDFMLGEGTNEVRRYPCRLKFAATGADDRRARSIFRSGRPTTEEIIDFDIIDGRGGDLAPTVPDSELDATALSRREQFRDALLESSGAIICMPIQKAAYNVEVATRFLRELERVKEKKKEDSELPRLERVAICYTIYEAEFVTHGPYAIDVASDRNEFRRRIIDHASLMMFANFVRANSGDDAFDLRFFPVSSFGFLGEGGSANFYDHPIARGLKTRAIDPYDDYDNPDLPGYEAHFPYPLTQAEAAAQWWPYNVASPVLFALTGRVTGPLSLEPSELGFHLGRAQAMPQ